jgi:S1-C subfamily serine protease
MSASSGGPLAALSNDLAAAVETVGRSVVAVHARRRIPASGIVWQPGVIVAAHHTVKRNDDIGITLHDGSTVPATLAGRDPSTDLAVLRLPPEVTAAAAPPVAPTSEPPRVGQLALALGRPGTAVTASLGIVSAVSGEWRTWQGGTIDHFVRLDVAVYDGFSGGPLVDAGGRVVGVNTSGLARAAALTVPASTVARVTGQLLASGHIARGWLGIATQPVRLPAALRRDLGLDTEVGLVVVNVEPQSPADRGGVLIGDIVVAVGGRAVSDPADVLAALGGERIGQPLVLRVARGGKDERVTVTVGERPHGRG